jgi:hypothetical protein
MRILFWAVIAFGCALWVPLIILLWHVVGWLKAVLS